MLIVATFKHSAYLELALKLLQQAGISKDDLLVAPLGRQVPDGSISDFMTVHKDGKSPFDLAFIFATLFMLLGAIYGFVLPWGPIIWSLIGIVIGAVVGIGLDYVIHKKSQNKSNKADSEIVLLVHCDAHHSPAIESVLWKHQALGISKVSGYTSAP